MAAAAKPEATPAPADAAAAAAPAVAASASSGLKAWIPTIVALIFAPAACWAVAQFLLLPQLKKSLTIDVATDAPVGTEAGAPPSAGGSKAEAGPSKAGAKGAESAPVGGSYKFENVVVNLSGTMGTRYLKTTFLVTGTQPDIAARFEAARPQLLDVTIGVLSLLTLQDLEEPGAKNVIREKLVNSYNQTLGSRVAEQVYFSDFVVQ